MADVQLKLNTGATIPALGLGKSHFPRESTRNSQFAFKFVV